MAKKELNIIDILTLQKKYRLQSPAPKTPDIETPAFDPNNASLSTYKKEFEDIINSYFDRNTTRITIQRKDTSAHYKAVFTQDHVYLSYFEDETFNYIYSFVSGNISIDNKAVPDEFIGVFINRVIAITEDIENGVASTEME